MSILSYPKSGSASLRRGRFSQPGRIYLVTFHTEGRRPLFLEWNLACAMVRASTSAHVLRGSRVLCWVLMPDHWHGLVEVGSMDDLSSLVRRMKGVSARQIGGVDDTRRIVWAQGFHDRAVRTDDNIVNIARYIILNPVRAGLVERVGSY